MSTETDGEPRIDTNVETDTAPAGLATTALRPAVRLLVQRPASLGELVTASGVSRRGVEALLASWQEDEPAEGGLKVDDEDRYRLTEPLRSRVAAEWGIDQPTDDRRLCDPAMIERLTAWATDLPRPRRDLDHRPATPEGVADRLDLLATHLDLRGASVLVLGARDLDAAALAADGRAGRVAALDVDDAVLAAGGASDRPATALTLRWCDVRVGLPASLTGWADLVISDPPYTPAGMEAFLAAATGALSGPEARVAISYGFGETRATLGWQVQREMLRANLALCAMWPDAVSYEGAEAIGGRADLYLLAPTGRERQPTELAHHLYTQGPAAARSATEADPVPLTLETEVADDLGRESAPTGSGDGSAQPLGVRRLLGGDQAPKLRAGAVPVVDLRGDPGGWLPRTLLALPAPVAVLVCDVDGRDRSPDPAERSVVDGRGWMEAHLSAQWRLDPADRAVEGADLLVARRVDHPDEAADAEPTTGPPLVGRGHANPRNVIGEWLTRSGDPDVRPSRRQACAAAAGHLASLGIDIQPGDSLIDLPLDRIAALLADPVPR